LIISDRFQKPLTLPSRTRGSYLITDHILKELPEIKSYKTGLLNLFIQHTSCALSLNENYDDDVRADMSDALDRIVPEDKGSRKGLYRHDAEGSDDMPVSNQVMRRQGNGLMGGSVGTCQVSTGWRERYDSDYEWTAEYRNVAGYLVFGVQRLQAHEEGCGDNSG
jgi:secondary thiamine-phosphate synthase enzyme